MDIGLEVKGVGGWKGIDRPKDTVCYILRITTREMDLDQKVI
jgi:hypothetical protein